MMLEKTHAEMIVQRPKPMEIHKLGFEFEKGRITRITAYYTGNIKRRESSIGLRAEIPLQHHEELVSLLKMHHVDENVIPTPETFHGGKKLRQTVVTPLKELLRQWGIKPKPVC